MFNRILISLLVTSTMALSACGGGDDEQNSSASSSCAANGSPSDTTFKVVSATSGVQSVCLAWNPVQGATEYWINSTPKGTNNYQNIGKTSETSFLHINLASGTTHSYALIARGANNTTIDEYLIEGKAD